MPKFEVKIRKTVSTLSKIQVVADDDAEAIKMAETKAKESGSDIEWEEDFTEFECEDMDEIEDEVIETPEDED